MLLYYLQNADNVNNYFWITYLENRHWALLSTCRWQSSKWQAAAWMAFFRSLSSVLLKCSRWTEHRDRTEKKRKTRTASGRKEEINFFVALPFCVYGGGEIYFLYFTTTISMGLRYVYEWRTSTFYFLRGIIRWMWIGVNGKCGTTLNCKWYGNALYNYISSIKTYIYILKPLMLI